MLSVMYSKKDVPGDDSPMNIERKSQTGILYILAIKDGVNQVYFEKFCVNLKSMIFWRCV